MRDLTLAERKVFERCEAARSGWSQEMAVSEGLFTGNHRMQYLPEALRREIGEHVQQLVIGLPAFVVEAYENRLDVEGFTLPGQSGDSGLWDMWQANGMDGQSQLGHLDALSLGRAAVIVGVGEGDSAPLVTVESATSVGWVRNPATRRLTGAVKRWHETDSDGRRVERATLYLPGMSLWLVSGPGGWLVESEDAHGYPVPVVPLVNRPRLGCMEGVPEFQQLIPLYGAVNKIASDMMVSAEYHAMPRRWIFGMKKSDFVDPKTGRPVSMWSQLAGRIWANENKDVQVGQFPEANLANFHDTIKLLIQVASMLAALPPHYTTFTGDNPASADAIRSSESQLVKRSERKQRYFGDDWEDTARLMWLFSGRALPEKASGLETVWRDPSTPTVAQKADAVVKLASAKTPEGVAILPLEKAREDLGYSPAERDEMRAMDAAAASAAADRASAVTSQLLRGVADGGDAASVA